MKHLLVSFVFAICCFISINSHCQTSDISDEDIGMAYYYTDGSFYLSFSQMKILDGFTYGSDDKSNWYAIGMGVSYDLYDWKKYCVYADIGGNFGWSGKSDNYLIDLYASVDFSANILPSERKDKQLALHFGMGVLDNMVGLNDSYYSSYYNYKDLYSVSAYAPLGIRLQYKNVFLDFTYRLRFLRGKTRDFEAEETADILLDTADLLLKSKPASYVSVKSFPFSVSLGIRL